MDPKRQKLIGLKTQDGKQATDAAIIADLAIKPNSKVLMMGQPEAVIQKQDEDAQAAPEVQVGCTGRQPGHTQLQTSFRSLSWLSSQSRFLQECTGCCRAAAG